MPRSTREPEFCTRCGKHKSIVGQLSRRGICEQCREQGVRKSITEMSEHNGETFQKWRRNHAAAVGAIFLEDLPPEIRAQLP